MAALTLDDVMGAITDLRREMQAEIAELKSELEEVRARQTAHAARSPAPAAQEVSQETLAIMAAVVTAYLGKKVRIRSARCMPQPAEPFSIWAHRGRIISHASHLPHAH